MMGGTRSVRELTERAYFAACLALGRLLRAATYSRIRISKQGGVPVVRKNRSIFAPLLIWIGGVVVRVLNTGTRVLAQRDWEERERLIYQQVRGISIEVDADGTLVLPFIAGETLAKVLDDPHIDEPARRKAIEGAVVALAEFHRLGFTHADAMAENVLIDGVCTHWFDFETIHDASRPVAWRRADDVRALVSSCLIRIVPEKGAETLRLILDVYADEDVARVLAASFTSVWRRSLAFHLAQARLSFQTFREIGRLLRQQGMVAH